MPNQVQTGLFAGNIEVPHVLFNMLVAAALAFLVGWHFRRFGSTYSNRAKFARVLPVIAVTTMIVITVVKSSLALSLGLVGALSIVRFRTPVKEPEELGYLFIAIAIGLGMGADQGKVTVVGIPVILLVLTIGVLLSRRSRYPNLYLNVSLPGAEKAKGALHDLLDVLGRSASTVDLRRYDVQDSTLDATFYVECRGPGEVTAIHSEVADRFPGATLTFVEQSSLPGA